MSCQDKTPPSTKRSNAFHNKPLGGRAVRQLPLSSASRRTARFGKQTRRKQSGILNAWEVQHGARTFASIGGNGLSYRLTHRRRWKQKGDLFQRTSYYAFHIAMSNLMINIDMFRLSTAIYM